MEILMILLALTSTAVLILWKIEHDKLTHVMQLLDLDVEAAQKAMVEAREAGDREELMEAIGALSTANRIRGGIRGIL